MTPTTVDWPAQTCCPVCGAELTLSSVRPTAVRALRGDQTWGNCPNCQSWFQMGGYDVDQEVEHTRNLPWGKQTSGLALNRYKARMFDSVIRLLSRHGVQSGALLDVGTSYGGFPLMARDRGFQVRAMDIVPEAIQYVREQGIPCDKATSVGDLNLPDRSLDVVSVLDCICYWPDHRKELRSIHQKLAPYGLLVIRTPTKGWMLRAGIMISRVFPRLGGDLCVRAITEHRSAISVSSYLDILKREGFEVLYASPIGAQHSDQSSWPVRLSFVIGAALWKGTGMHVAPGFLILCRKASG